VLPHYFHTVLVLRILVFAEQKNQVFFQFLELLYYGTNVHDREYQALYNGGPVLDAFVRLTGMPLDKMHYLPKELRKYTKKQYK